MKIIVYHSYYGCDTGCCGHVVECDDGTAQSRSAFDFTHPCGEDHLEFAKEMVRDHFGAEHVADLDWENCIISDD